MASGDKQRKDRIARNEALFREVNERVRDIVGEDDSGTIEFLCECGDNECTQSVALTTSEYERLRADPVLFAVLPGHEIESVEEVVDRNDRFYVVRKDPGQQAVARDTDPRS